MHRLRDALRECVTALPFTSSCTSNCATCPCKNKRVTRLSFFCLSSLSLSLPLPRRFSSAASSFSLSPSRPLRPPLLDPVLLAPASSAGPTGASSSARPFRGRSGNEEIGARRVTLSSRAIASAARCTFTCHSVICIERYANRSRRRGGKNPRRTRGTLTITGDERPCSSVPELARDGLPATDCR